MAKLTRKKGAGDFDTEAARTKLETGHWYPRQRGDEKPPLSDEQLRELWEAIGAEPKREFAKLHPGERCWGEQTFEAH